jgi:two-component system, OmpR family, alkaline phosphatase synthesis response regulator PhoP
MKNNILVVEDDLTNSKLLKDILENDNFLFHHVNSGAKSLEYFKKQAIIKNQEIDLILLDLNLPDTTGFEILKRIRSCPLCKHIPIIILTSNTDKLDTVLALEIGADDYITKPFYNRELIARINAVLRRYRLNPNTNNNIIDCGNLKIYSDTRNVTLFDKDIDLTFKEFEILSLFCNNPGKVFSRDELINTIWGYDYILNTRAVDMHIASLRKKIYDTKQNNSYIETIRGVGYRFRK